MGVRNASSGNNTIITATFASGVEAVLCTTGLIGLVQDNAQVIIQWWYTLTYGSTTTTITPRLRRGAAVTSANVFQATNLLTATATQAQQAAGTYVDTPGVLGQVQYSLTLQVAGGGTNTNIGDVALVAYVL